MQYRRFVNDNINISVLGYGCMRFPLLNPEDNSSINKKQASKLLKYAIENGVNYIDTAYNYHGGESEIFVGEFLKSIHRENVFLATKMPVWLCDEFSKYKNIFEEQLSKLQTEYIDFYLAHSLYRKTFESIKKNNIFKFFDQEKENGRIKYVGFSFHDDLELFKEIVDCYDWDFCQIQLNYMDEYYQAGIEGLNYAKAKGLDVIIMEPVKGGKLAKAPTKIENSFKDLNENYSMAQWALKWIYDKLEISLALSGMSNMEQVKENILIATESLTNSLAEKELKTIEHTRDFFNKRIQIGCTDCEYCMPCPENIQIPSIFSKFNNSVIYDEKSNYTKEYLTLVKEGKDSTKCVECGHCESMCPQHLPIIKTLKKANEYFGN